MRVSYVNFTVLAIVACRIHTWLRSSYPLAFCLWILVNIC
nr:MAG TPA: hypothetical protein [Caudoviricetes sp.]